MLGSPFIVTHQAIKPCEWLWVDAPKRSARQWGTPMAQTGNGLGDPGGDTGDTQHPDAFFDLADLVGYAGAAEQQAFSPAFDRLLGVKDKLISHPWIPGLKIRHGQWCLIGPHELVGEPH